MDSESMVLSSNEGEGEKESEEEDFKCESCRTIQDASERADNSCSCVLCEYCNDKWARKIICYACPKCEAHRRCSSCAEFQYKNEELASENQQLKKKIEELTKQLKK